MHAFIIVGGSHSTRRDYIQELLTTGSELIHLTAQLSTLTIEQIHDLTSSLSITTRSNRLVWIEEAQQLSVPAQNALLKMLEEPPSHTTFYLTCHQAESLLPTIRSRCQVITLKPEPTSHLDHLSSLKAIMALSPGDRLMSIVKRDRAQSIEWIKEIEFALKDKLTDPSLTPIGYTTLAKIARLALDAHAQFAANCSVSLVTQNFLLALPKSK